MCVCVLTIDLQEAVRRGGDLVRVRHCEAVGSGIRIDLEHHIRVTVVLEVDRQAQLLERLQDLCSTEDRSSEGCFKHQ